MHSRPKDLLDGSHRVQIATLGILRRRTHQRKCFSGVLLRVELTPLLVQSRDRKEELRVVVFDEAPQDGAEKGSDHGGHPMGFVFENPLPVKQSYNEEIYEKSYGPRRNKRGISYWIKKWL